METTAAAITTATNRNIILGIVEKSTTRNAVARKSGIPATTFNRKLDNGGDFTLRELGAVAGALDKTLADILPAELLTGNAA